MLGLLLDIKRNIASYDEELWMKFVIHDEEFRKFAYTTEGLQNYTVYFIDTIKPINKDGVLKWYYNDKLHRGNDLPAIYYNDLCQGWYKFGQEHRENDQPAFINYSWQHWMYNGKLHRIGDQPAVVSKYTKVWYFNGKCHRATGPAVITTIYPAHILNGDNDDSYCVIDSHQEVWYNHGNFIKTIKNKD